MPLTANPISVQSADDLSFQTADLTEYEGAKIKLDVRAVGHANHPRFECQLRIGSILQETFATATRDVKVLVEAPWRREIIGLNIPQIKAKMGMLGASDAIRGKTKKADLLAALRATMQTQQPDSERIVARAGDVGQVVKPLFVDEDGEHRIGVSFERGTVTNVRPYEVTLGEPSNKHQKKASEQY